MPPAVIYSNLRTAIVDIVFDNIIGTFEFKTVLLQVIYFVKTQIALNVLLGWKKQIYFSALNVGKKVSSFWEIDCESLPN